MEYVTFTIDYKLALDFLLEVKHKTQEELNITDTEFGTLVKFYTYLLQTVNIFEDAKKEKVNMCYLLDDAFLIIGTLYQIISKLALQDNELRLLNLTERILTNLLSTQVM